MRNKVGLLAGLSAVATLVAGALLIDHSSPARSAGVRPNIVVIMTDDQDLRSMEVMPKVKRLLADQGTTFTNSFVNYSLCCPSRTTFLTGQYAHNHGVVGNALPDGGYERLPASTLPVWLRKSGYKTAHIGKFLNEYGRRDPREIPPGWQDWQGLSGGSTYQMWGYTINENGTLRTYGRRKGGNPRTYQTDVLTDKAVTYIRQLPDPAQPYFLSFATLAPHTEVPLKGQEFWSGPRPAPRHKGMFADLRLPESPSFNEADMSDKPRHLPRRRLNDKLVQGITEDYRSRLESLQAVDDAVERIVQAIEARGELDRTLIIFTSDNGYLMGQHRVRADKIHPYEESIRVPLIVRGPGFRRGAKVGTPVVNADLAPTITSAALATPAVPCDGRPLQELSRRDRNRDILIETGPKRSGEPWYAAIRTDGHLYVEHSTGDRELYDLAADPYQLDSRHADPKLATLRQDLSARLQRLRKCSGGNCP